MRRIAIAALVVVVVGVAVLAGLRGAGLSAVHGKPFPFEARIARATWRWLVPSAVRTRANPVSMTPAGLTDARAHFADHCAVCHDNDGSGETAIGRRVYPPMPDLRATGTQRLTDGELFYAIEQGIPWTAMPGWTTRTPQGEVQSWALVRFIRHLPAITPDELKEMEALNPRTPPNAQQEKEIEDFLKGPASASGK